MGELNPDSLTILHKKGELWEINLIKKTDQKKYGGPAYMDDPRDAI